MFVVGVRSFRSSDRTGWACPSRSVLVRLLDSPWGGAGCRVAAAVRPRSAEGEAERLDACVEELDLEGAFADRGRLADELVRALLGDRAVAVGVDVGSVRGGGWSAVQADAERDRRSALRRAHHEVDVARLEAERDPSAGLGEHSCAVGDRPRSGRRPVVEAQSRGRGVVVRLVLPETVGRGEPGRLTVAEVRLGGAQAPIVGRHLEAAGIDRHETLIDVGGTGVQQQLLDRHLRHGVFALAEVVVPDPSLCVGEVDRRPEVIGERPPDAVVVVERDRVGDLQGAGLRDDVVDVVLEVELGRVGADDRQPLLGVLGGPGADIGQRPEPVDAGVGPEVDEDDAAARALPASTAAS